MSDLKLTHAFYRKNGSWKIWNPQECEHNGFTHLDCNLCALGFALGFAIEFNKEFHDFCKKGNEKDYITGELSNRICFDRFSSDIELWFEKQATSFTLQLIDTDYMHLDTKGTPVIIGKVYFNKLLEDVIALTQNSSHGFTLIEEKDGMYSVSKLVIDSKD